MATLVGTKNCDGSSEGRGAEVGVVWLVLALLGKGVGVVRPTVRSTVSALLGGTGTVVNTELTVTRTMEDPVI